jgi:hypothetical protein
VAPELYALHRASAARRPTSFGKINALRPAPAGKASRVERETALLELFGGRAAAENLPLVAVDRGAAFEPALRHVVAPGSLSPPPRVLIQDVKATGLEPWPAEQALMARLPWYEACSMTSSSTGSVQLSWTVGAQGNVTGVWSRESEKMSQSVRDCLVRHSHGLAGLPATGKPTRFTARLAIEERPLEGNPNIARPRDDF